MWTRQTYGLLDFLGDLGGLYGLLTSIAGVLLTPFISFTLQSSIMSSIFRIRNQTYDESKKAKIHTVVNTQRAVKYSLGYNHKKPKLKNCLSVNVFGFCLKKAKANRYRRLLEKTEASIASGLDLDDFFRSRKLL